MNKIYLNIASSTQLLDDFINLDSSIYIKLAKYYPVTKLFLAPKYKDSVLIYRDALKKKILNEHDCRKNLLFKNQSVDHILCSHFLEHVYPDECSKILKDFLRVLKVEGTLHLILPDMNILIQNYITGKAPDACDKLITETILTKEKRPSLKYRLLEITGKYGLQHYWMYDKESMAFKLKNIGFEILENHDTPSSNFRKNDGISFHIIAQRKI